MTCECIVCGQEAYAIAAIAGQWNIFKCGHCRQEFTHPMPTAQDFAAFYADYSDPLATRPAELLNAARNIAELRKFGLTDQSTVLDYGSGQGIYKEVSNAASWYNYDLYTHDNRQDLLLADNYDWVTSWGVLEHLASPISFLRQIKKLLKKQGKLALTTVSIETGIPYRWKPPEHVSYWTKTAMEILMRKEGFTIVAYRPYLRMLESEAYLEAVLRTVPRHLRKHIDHSLPGIVEVPTNEVFIVATVSA